MSEAILAFANEKSRLEMVLTDTTMRITPSGRIDKTFDLTAVAWSLLRLSGKLHSALFDMKAVETVDQAGIENWNSTMNQVPKCLPLVYLNLKESFIEYLNRMTPLTGHTVVVESFEAPFYCATCQKEHSILLESKNIQCHSQGFSFPELKCNECKNSLTFAGLENEYFRFLKQPTNQSN